MSEVKPVLDLQQECIEHFEATIEKMHSSAEWLRAETDSLRVLLAKSFQEGHAHGIYIYSICILVLRFRFRFRGWFRFRLLFSFGFDGQFVNAHI